MARLSKTTPFQIYSDKNSTPTREDSNHHDEVVNDGEKVEGPFAWSGARKDDGFVTESDDDGKAGQHDGAQEGDDEKNYTRTSISSFPESSYPTDLERTPMHKPYTPNYARPSSRRMQMSSPLRKGKFGTPFSEPRGSPRSRRRDIEDDGDGQESKRLPLVLLHITALPMKVSWTIQSMRETLPQHTLDNLQLLKSKLSETVLKRGILIPHPREDYELLEEKLLETLELQEPRISKCGHYRARPSTDSTVTTASGSTDSGMGSSVDGSDEEHCSTCHHHLRAAGSGTQKWSIKVYAANGLMRASAWSAAWSEMERVDVEILPWIKDDLRIKLDELNAQDLTTKEVDHEADETRINQLVEERLRLIEEDAERAREAEMSREIERIVIDEQRQQSQTAQEDPTQYIEAAKTKEREASGQPASTELPNIYRPKDIPLSVLLRNYVFLLARKPINMAVFFLLVTVGGLLISMGQAEMSARATEFSSFVQSKAAEFRRSDMVSIPALEDSTTPVLEAVPESVLDTEASLETMVAVSSENTITVTLDADLPLLEVNEHEEEHADAGQLHTTEALNEPEAGRKGDLEAAAVQEQEEEQASTGQLPVVQALVEGETKSKDVPEEAAEQLQEEEPVSDAEVPATEAPQEIEAWALEVFEEPEEQYQEASIVMDHLFGAEAVPETEDNGNDHPEEVAELSMANEEDVSDTPVTRIGEELLDVEIEQPESEEALVTAEGDEALPEVETVQSGQEKAAANAEVDADTEVLMEDIEAPEYMAEHTAPVLEDAELWVKCLPFSPLQVDAAQCSANPSDDETTDAHVLLD